MSSYLVRAVTAAGFLAISATAGFAQGVQPRFSPPVEDRSGRVTPPERGTPAPAARTRPSTRALQELGDTEVVRGGVAPGLQLRNVRCKGVVCRTFEDTAGDLVIAVEGSFPGTPGSTMAALTIDMKTGNNVESRTKGVFSDGRFRDSISTYKLAPGTYGVAYAPLGVDEFYAGVQFDVVRHRTAASGRAGGDAGMRPDTTEAIEAARRMQNCRALATNDNLTCGQ